MSKAPGRGQTRYVCQSCGESFLRWEGQCRACSAWNSLVETVVRTEPRSPRISTHARIAAGTTTLAAAGGPQHDRVPIGIAELDRVLGGGLVPGSVVLVGGEPGIGKSTLLLQAAAGVAAGGGSDRVLYATGGGTGAQGRLPGGPPRGLRRGGGGECLGGG